MQLFSLLLFLPLIFNLSTLKENESQSSTPEEDIPADWLLNVEIPIHALSKPLPSPIQIRALNLSTDENANILFPAKPGEPLETTRTVLLPNEPFQYETTQSPIESELSATNYERRRKYSEGKPIPRPLYIRSLSPSQDQLDLNLEGDLETIKPFPQSTPIPVPPASGQELNIQTEPESKRELEPQAQSELESVSETESELLFETEILSHAISDIEARPQPPIYPTSRLPSLQPIPQSSPRHMSNPDSMTQPETSSEIESIPPTLKSVTHSKPHLIPQPQDVSEPDTFLDLTPDPSARLQPKPSRPQSHTTSKPHIFSEPELLSEPNPNSPTRSQHRPIPRPQLHPIPQPRLFQESEIVPDQFPLTRPQPRVTQPKPLRQLTLTHSAQTPIRPQAPTTTTARTISRLTSTARHFATLTSRPKASPKSLKTSKVIPTPVFEEDSADYKCTKDGYYSIGNECKFYITCRQSSVKKHKCPDGLQFDKNAQYPEYPCKYPSEVQCEYETSTKENRPTSECPRRYGFFPMTDGDCTRYINCQKGLATTMNCPPGLYFNEKLSACDWPENVQNCQSNVFEGYSCPTATDDYSEPYDNDLNVKYRYKDSCKQYVMCLEGHPRLLSCDEGLAFDEESETCIDADYVQNCF